MAFWSGETVSRNLSSLITPFDLKSVNYASYELAVGSEAFVTRDGLIAGNPAVQLTAHLEKRPPQNTIVIEPGQFAFLLTEEVVEVPNNAIALISMKASLKFRGLINVSGFHVDPGFKGHLLFSIYNAGPREIILRRSQKVFIIVYADLDQASSAPFVYAGAAQGQDSIKTELIDHIATGQVFSPMRLQTEMTEIRKDLTAVRTRAGLIDGVVLTAIGIFISAVLGFGAALFGSDTAVSTVGFWMKSAMQKYDEQEKKLHPSKAGNNKATE
jgi:dCTP deaminase